MDLEAWKTSSRQRAGDDKTSAPRSQIQSEGRRRHRGAYSSARADRSDAGVVWIHARDSSEVRNVKCLDLTPFAPRPLAPKLRRDPVRSLPVKESAATIRAIDWIAHDENMPP